MLLRRSRILLGFIVMSILLGLSGLVIPGSSMANAAGGVDKANAVTPISEAVMQDGKELGDGDTIDPDKPFKIKKEFQFPIINDEMLDTDLAEGLTKETQVDDGDYWVFPLGSNFKPADATGTEVAVHVNAEGTPEHGKRIGTITLSQDDDGNFTAKMLFGGPDAELDYEPDGRRDVTVTFEGEFWVATDAGGEPGSQQGVVKIFGKEYKLPEVVEEINYNFTKAGKISGPELDTILWTVAVDKQSNTKKKLAGETFTDDLSDVGEYVDGSFKVNGDKVEGVYNAETKTLTYVFPESFNSAKATITFSTKITDPAQVTDPNAPGVKNVAKLSYSHEDSKTAEATVPIYQKPKITKTYSGIEVDEKTKERAMIWTIVAGTPNVNYGPAWVGDILRAQKDGQERPTRTELVVEHNVSGKDDGWQRVDDANIGTLKEGETFPEFPAEGDTCPDVSGYNDKEVYHLGSDWHEGTREVDPKLKYEELQNHWMFIKELNGQYRFTVKLIFAEGVEVGPLQNDAEIHTCGDFNFPVTPPVYNGVATITKKARKSYDSEVLNQGNLRWEITADFSKLFPSKDRYAYELFYYGSEDDYKSEKGLRVEGDLPGGTLEALLKGDKGEPFVNFNQSYLDGSLKPAKEDNLTAKTFPLFNEGGTQVGELVQIAGFTKVKTYKFELQTHAQDLLDLIQESTAGSYSSKYKNTAVLVTGKDDTLKLIPASSWYGLKGQLLDKYAIEFDTNLDSMSSVSKNGWDSSYRDYVTGIPLVDKTKTFNYQNRTALFRIDVNPTGLKLPKYAESLGIPSEMDLTNLSVTDELPDGFSLEPLETGGSDYFAIYKAKPGEAGFIDYSITYGESPAFNTYMPPGEALERVSAKDAGVSFDKDKLTWNFSNYDGTPYFIVIKTKMSEEVFGDLVKNAAQAKFETYTNKVSLKAGDKDLANEDAKLQIKPYLLTKEDPKVDGSNLKWTFTYKPFDQEFEDVVIEDQLDENIAISLDDEGQPNLDDFKISRSNELQPSGDYAEFSDVKLVKGDPKDGEVGISYDAAEHKIFFKLPNSPANTKPYAYKVEYPTVVRLANPDAKIIVNKVKALASNAEPSASGEGSINMDRYSAFARLAGKPYVALKKVDNEGQALSGAVFSYQNSDGETVKTVSDGKGMVYLINLPEDTVTITELKAPKGFVKLSQPIVVEIAEKPYTVKSGLTGVTGDGSFKNPFEVPNEEEPEEPSEPSEPSEPTEPTEPSEPTEPTEPTTPSEPSEPTEPSEPSEPTEPSESNPTSPSSPSQTTGKPGTGLSKTGVSDATLPLGIAALVLLAAGIVVVRRTH